jgi:hypothetical protein
MYVTSTSVCSKGSYSQRILQAVHCKKKLATSRLGKGKSQLFFTVLLTLEKKLSHTYSVSSILYDG